jgi:hypothetical protein
MHLLMHLLLQLEVCYQPLWPTIHLTEMHLHIRPHSERLWLATPVEARRQCVILLCVALIPITSTFGFWHER